MYLIDSDWTIDYIGRTRRARELLDTLDPHDIAISQMTQGEVYEGIYYGRDRDRMEPIFDRFLETVALLPLDSAVMRRFAILRGGLRREGRLISDTDLLIAATAIESGRTLVTRNLRDFARVPGLTLHQTQ